MFKKKEKIKEKSKSIYKGSIWIVTGESCLHIKSKYLVNRHFFLGA
jgi:hypothetical protein